jgi:hypothetical protein
MRNWTPGLALLLIFSTTTLGIGLLMSFAGMTSVRGTQASGPMLALCFTWVGVIGLMAGLAIRSQAARIRALEERLAQLGDRTTP